MDKKYLTLDDILNDPEFVDVFDPKPHNQVMNADQRLVESFEEINKFIDQNGYTPNNLIDMNERKLAKRLKGILVDQGKVNMLKEFDRHNLLQLKEKFIESLDDILHDDVLANILGSDDLSAANIFDLKHVKHSSERQWSDFIARRKVCKNFAKYEPLFKQCQAELKLGKRSLISFNQKNLMANTYFVLNGQLAYLESITDSVKRGGNKHDGRVYCVFENGTESNMQVLSLVARMYEVRKLNQAFTVSELPEEATTKFVNAFNLINEKEDQATGYIYILKSLSDNPRIADIENLYKIGYSTTPVDERIKNAEKEPTYLMAKVKLISEFKCFNLNPQKFEQLLHRFFANACLNLDIFGEEGKRYNPREWFIVPLSIIEEVISLIISGDIVSYKYDHVNQMLIRI